MTMGTANGQPQNYQWEFRRQIKTSSVVYDRYYHDIGGAAVVYGGETARTFLVFINGVRFDVPFPDSKDRYHNPEGEIDPGNPLSVRIRWDAEWGWTLYAYMFNGNNNPHPEWDVQIPAMLLD